MENRRGGFLAIFLATVLSIAFVFSMPRIPQDPGYHDFSDKRPFLDIPNFLDVVSNAAFIIVGFLGLRALTATTPGRKAVLADKREAWFYFTLYLGILLTGFGSGYYHIAPDNETLVWDRIPMAILFASFVSSIISERISLRAGLILLGPFLLAAMGSVIYWGLSERAGNGDLRPYAFVHYFPLLLIPIIMYFYPSRYTRGGDIFFVIGFYALAIISQHLDKTIFAFSHLVSGHTLKHLLAATAIYWHIRMLKKRQQVNRLPHAD